MRIIAKGTCPRLRDGTFSNDEKSAGSAGVPCCLEGALLGTVRRDIEPTPRVLNSSPIFADPHTETADQLK
jgi:hypothetical protein